MLSNLLAFSLPDLFLAESGDEEVQVMRNVGGGAFDNPLRRTTVTTPNAVAIGDVDNDGKADYVVASRPSSGGAVAVYQQADTGAFGFDAPVALTPANGVNAVLLEDLDWSDRGITTFLPNLQLWIFLSFCFL